MSYSKFAKVAGKGQDGEPEFASGTDICICPKCSNEVSHERGTPCDKIKCSKCGTMMTGKGTPKSKKIAAASEFDVAKKWVNSEGDKLIDQMNRIITKNLRKHVIGERPDAKFEEFLIQKVQGKLAIEVGIYCDYYNVSPDASVKTWNTFEKQIKTSFNKYLKNNGYNGKFSQAKFNVLTDQKTPTGVNRTLFSCRWNMVSMGVED